MSDIRKEFEAAWLAQYPDHGACALKRSRHFADGYANTRVQDGWLMYQAALRTPSAAAAPIAQAAAQAEPIRPTDDALWDQTLQERDEAEEIGTLLAQAVGEFFGIDVGEHSSANDPRAAALKIFDEVADVPLASKLIDAWTAENGRQIPWDKAVRITALVMNQSDAERDALLSLGDAAAPAEQRGETIYQLQCVNGSWVDATKETFDSMGGKDMEIEITHTRISSQYCHIKVALREDVYLVTPMIGPKDRMALAQSLRDAADKIESLPGMQKG